MSEEWAGILPGGLDGLHSPNSLGESFIEAGAKIQAGIGIRTESLGIGSQNPAVSQDLERTDRAFTLAE